MRPLRAVVTDSTLPREATMKTLRPLVVSLAAPSKKKVRWPSPELWNCPGATRERSERRSNTSLSRTVRSFCQGQTKSASTADQEQHRPARPQHRPDEALQRHAAREPDRHLARPVHARQRRHHRDEQRQRQHRRQVAEGDVGEQQRHVLRVDAAHRGLAEGADEEDGEDDRQDDDQRAAEVARQLSTQSGIE